jgi:hypothetical protein
MRFLLVVQRGENPLLQNCSAMGLYFAKCYAYTRGWFDMGGDDRI